MKKNNDSGILICDNSTMCYYSNYLINTRNPTTNKRIMNNKNICNLDFIINSNFDSTSGFYETIKKLFNTKPENTKLINEFSSIKNGIVQDYYNYFYNQLNTLAQRENYSIWYGYCNIDKTYYIKRELLSLQESNNIPPVFIVFEKINNKNSMSIDEIIKDTRVNDSGTCEEPTTTNYSDLSFLQENLNAYFENRLYTLYIYKNYPDYNINDGHDELINSDFYNDPLDVILKNIKNIKVIDSISFPEILMYLANKKMKAIYYFTEK